MPRIYARYQPVALLDEDKERSAAWVRRAWLPRRDHRRKRTPDKEPEVEATDEANPSLIRTSDRDNPAMGTGSATMYTLGEKTTRDVGSSMVAAGVPTVADAQQQSDGIAQAHCDAAQGDKRAPDPSKEPFWAQCDRCFKWRTGVGGHLWGVALARWRCEYAARSCGDACDWCHQAECSCKGNDYEVSLTEEYRMPVGFWAVVRFRNSSSVPVGTPWLVYRSVCSGCGSTSPGMDRRDKLAGWLRRHRSCKPEWKGLSLEDFDFRLSTRTRDMYRQYLLAVKGGMKLSFGDLLLALQPFRDAWIQGKWREVREFAHKFTATTACGAERGKSTEGLQLRSHYNLGKKRGPGNHKDLMLHGSAVSAAQSANGRLQGPDRSGSKHPLQRCDEQRPKQCRLEELVLAAEQDMQQFSASTRRNLHNRAAVSESMMESAQELLLLQHHPPVRLPDQAHVKLDYVGS